MPNRHVIVGAGPAGLCAIETIRALSRDARITLVCDEPPYARMVLPYYMAGEVERAHLSTGDESWFRDLNVETVFGRRVSRVDPGSHQLTLDDDSTLAYDRLLLATGARTRAPAIEGCEGPGVLALWTLADAGEFLAAEKRDVVIVGAGFIAFTILDAVAGRADTLRFVEIESQVLPRMLDAVGAGLVESRLAERGIPVHKGVSVQRIEQAGSRRVLHCSNGERLECDLVILATGIRANLEFLEGSGVETGDGIRVDDHLRTNAPDVYAAGDVASGPDLMGGEARVQAIQPTAVDHGRVAGANMAGLDVEYSGSLTMNVVAAQGIEACSFGRWQESGDTVQVHNPVNAVYRKYVFDDDRMVGGALVGPTAAVSGLNDVGMLKGLIQTGVALGPWKAYLEENPLDLRRVFVASGAARALLDWNLLSGRVSEGGGYRAQKLPPVRGRSPHHATLVSHAPR